MKLVGFTCTPTEHEVVISRLHGTSAPEMVVYFLYACRWNLELYMEISHDCSLQTFPVHRI
jgi:hypothetical protein